MIAPDAHFARNPTPAMAQFHAQALERRARLWRAPVCLPAAKPAELPAAPKSEPKQIGPIVPFVDCRAAEFAKAKATCGLQMRDVMRIVAKHYGLTIANLTALVCYREFVRARHVAMFLCRETFQNRSLAEIARAFERRDHTTVFHAAHRIVELLTVDAKLACDVEALRSAIAVARRNADDGGFLSEKTSAAAIPGGYVGGALRVGEV